MIARPVLPKARPAHRTLFAWGVVLLAGLLHWVVIDWASVLMWRPKIVWVQVPLTLALEAPLAQSPTPLRATRSKPVSPAPAALPAQAPPPPPEQATLAQGGPEPVTPMAAAEPVAPPGPPPSVPEPVQAETPSNATQAPPAPGPLPLLGQAAQLPGVTQTMHYKVAGWVNTLTYQASSRLRFEPQAESGYNVSYQVGAFLLGKRQQVSQGRMGARGLEPRQFTDQSRRTQVTQVLFERQTVKLPANPVEQPWTPGTQDRLSVFVQLGAWVAADPKVFTPAGESFRVPVWSSRETETWLVVSQGNEQIPTPYGERQAIRLARMPLNPSDARVDMWFVPAWGALPVRIEMVEANGNRAEQTLSEIEPAPPTP